jgi:hypothetical protein
MIYRLQVSGAVVERIRLLADSALAQRQSRRYFESLTRLNDVLVHRPKESGEPLRDFTALNLVEYRLTIDPIHVFYSVDETRQIVYVQSINFMHNCGLSELP